MSAKGTGKSFLFDLLDSITMLVDGYDEFLYKFRDITSRKALDLGTCYYGISGGFFYVRTNGNFVS